jgi:hypothetical protein
VIKPGQTSPASPSLSVLKIILGQREDLIKWCNEGAKNARVEFGHGKKGSKGPNRSGKKGSSLEQEQFFSFVRSLYILDRKKNQGCPLTFPSHL